MISKLAVAVLSCGLAVTTPIVRAEQPPSATVKSVSPPAELLTPEEEKALAEQQEEPGHEVAGGALSNLHLTYIVIALSAAVLVLVLK
jgi:hypothetical protein